MRSGGSGSALEIDAALLGPDGCPTVALDTSNWGSLTASWHAGDDPFFQIHDNEAGFYANLEAYTVWGDDWTGQSGTFAPDCNGTGLCFWLLPDDEHAFLATAGEVDVVELEQSGGGIGPSFEVVLRGLTMTPMHEDPAHACLHMPEVVLAR